MSFFLPLYEVILKKQPIKSLIESYMELDQPSKDLIKKFIKNVSYKEDTNTKETTGKKA